MKSAAHEQHYRHYLSVLRNTYCAKIKDQSSARCKMLNLMAKREHKVVSKVAEKKQVKRTSRMYNAIKLAEKHYCTGKNKLMCQTVKGCKRMYVRSLEPGKRDLF